MIFKNICLISCDGLPLLCEIGVNIWFGGTSLKLDKLKSIIKIIISFEVIIPSLQLNARATEISYNENGRLMLKVPLNGL